MGKMYYHKLRQQIEDYIWEKGLEQATVDLLTMVGSILEDLRKEREGKLKDEPQVDHEGSTTP